MKVVFEMSANFISCEVAIERLSKEGLGIGFWNNKKIKVAHAYPEDVVKIDLYKRKKRGYFKGRLKEIIRPSKERCAVKCSHAQICGGCKLGQLAYTAQLSYKKQLLQKTFANFPKADILPVVPSEPWGYRNKMEFTFSENRAGSKFLGLMIAGAGKYVFNLEKCFLAPFWMSEVLNKVRIFWQSSSLKAFTPFLGTGILRYLTCRSAGRTRDKMVVLTVCNSSGFSREMEEKFAAAVKSALPAADLKGLSIILRVQHSRKGQKTYFEEKILFGKGFLLEELHILQRKISFKISASSFFQPNPLQAEKLFAKVLELAQIQTEKKALVLDLYAGSAALGLVFAPFAEKVVCVEENPSAAEDAEKNIALNGFSNICIQKADVADILNSANARSALEKADLAIVDPPRAGLSPKALENLASLKPEKIVYVSCNIATQAENILTLMQQGYALKMMQPVDQFPQTMHLENIALLVRS